MKRHRLAQVSLVFLAVLLVLALTAPLIARMRGIDPTMTDLLRRFEPPSAEFWFGTDELGRDLFQRLLDGGRVSLLVGFSGALLSAVIGSVIGVVAGYLGGRLDSLLMRVTDGVIALPLLPLLIVLAAIDPQKVGIPAAVAQSETFSLYRIVVIVALTGWTTVARLVRAETLSLKARDFTRAAQALGARPLRIMFRHILPNAMGSVVVATTMSIGSLILLESTLSFLGLGTQPPAASWGNMLTNAQDLLQDAPILALWPGLLIFLTVIAFNFLGDGLQDALDPRSERR
jgi:peptide/nickel transport system permease protein